MMHPRRLLLALALALLAVLPASAAYAYPPCIPCCKYDPIDCQPPPR